MKEEILEQVDTTETVAETAETVETAAEAEVENIPSMEEFEQEINSSFKKVNEGDIIKGTVIGVSDTEVTIDLGYYTEGIIKLEELSNDPRFSIKADIKTGDEISALIISEDDGNGNILLSMKQAADVLAWDKLKNDLENKTKKQVKIAQAVNGGVVTYLEGIRAFIPASMLSLTYVENLEDWIGKTIDVVIATADEKDKKLVLSGKEVEKEKALEDRNSKISKLQKGLVTTGIIDKIVPYGCFVNIGDELSGLVHISQICGKHIKSPNEVLKEGEEVKVKIIDIKDGKVSLSIKAVEEKEEVIDEVEEAPAEYLSGEEASTGLGALLAGIKLN
jgi:Ribosomal protein S1